MMGNGLYEGFSWLPGGMMMLPMMLFWIVPIALIVWGLTGLHLGQQPSRQNETPLEILQRRYASGEISQEEFEQSRRTLV